MPYSGADDPNLPPDIKKLDAKKRRQFTAVWNSAYQNCRDSKTGGGTGGTAGCEGVAFRFARSAVKEMTMEEEEETKEGRMISTANLKKIRDALAALNELLSAAEPPALTGKELDEEEPGLVERILDGMKGILFGNSREEGEKAEWDGKYINDLPDSAFAFISAGGEKDKDGKTVPRALRHLPYKNSGGEIDLPHLRNALARLSQSSLSPAEKESAGAVLRKAAEAKKVGEFSQKDIIGSFKVSKDAEGNWRWLSLTTNKYKDREGEIFSDEAHKEYVEYATAFKHYPELWIWHTPGSKVGTADFTDYVDGFVLHSGTFDKGKETVAASLAAATDLAVSHGYKYRATDKEDGVYDWYRTFEVSALPAARAANAWTDILSQKEVVMSFSEDKKAFLTKHLGEDAVKDIESKIAELSKQLEDAGVAFKDLVEGTPVSEAKAEEPVAEVEEETEADDNVSVPAGDNVSAQLQDISSKIEALGSQVEEVRGELTGFKGELAQLKRSDAQKIDDQVAPRRPAPGNGEGPANSEKTLVDAEKQAQLEEAANKAAAGGKDPYIGPYVDDLVSGRLVGGGVVTSGE